MNYPFKIPPKIKSSHSASPRFCLLNDLRCAHGHAHRLPRVRMRAELRAISWIPWQAQIREREESSRSEFVSTVQSPRIQVRAPGEHRRANILANISTRSGASVQVNEARVMPFSDSRERTEPASWTRPSLSSTLNRPRTFLLLHSLYISVHGLYKVPQTFIFKPGLSFPTFRVILLACHLFFALAVG